MKRIFIIMVLAALLSPFAASAQQKVKFGHVDYGDIIKQIPGIDTVQKVITDMQTELQTTYEEMVKEYQKKIEDYQQMTTKGTSPAVLKIKEDELTNMKKRIQDFSQSAEVDLQAKQVELLKPFQDKMLEVIKEVGKEHSFTYIFDTSTLLFFEQGEDVSAKVKQKLGIK